MPTTADRPATREEKRRRYVELSAFEAFLYRLGYLFEGVLAENTLEAFNPDMLRPAELDSLFEELWPDEFEPGAEPPELERAFAASNLLAARLFARAAGDSEWFARMAEQQLERASRAAKS